MSTRETEKTADPDALALAKLLKPSVPKKKEETKKEGD